MDKNSDKSQRFVDFIVYQITTKSPKFIAVPYKLRVSTWFRCTHHKRVTQLLISLLQHLPKVRLPYRGVCAKVLLGRPLEIVQVVDGRLAVSRRVGSHPRCLGYLTLEIHT